MDSNHVTPNPVAPAQNMTTFDWAAYMVQLETEGHSGLRQLVSTCPFTITDQQDDKGFTLLHHAVLGGVEGKVEALVLLAKECQSATIQQIKLWTNTRT